MEAGGNAMESERQFALRHWSAFLDGELPAADAARIEELMAKDPDAAAFVASHRQLGASVRDNFSRQAVPCPEGLRQRVLDALDRCEDPGHLAPLVRFPWLSVTALGAAAVMFAASLVLVFAPRDPAPDPSENLRARLTPMVANVSLGVPKSDRCRYRDASAKYAEYFKDGPELPRSFGDGQCRVSFFDCPEVNGRRMACAVYDDPQGDRFALIVFRCKRTADLLPDFLDAAELEIDGRRVLLWREGNFVRALVGSGPVQGLRTRATMLRPAA
ncbi:MAG: hypothetical protein KF754_01820 [Planctomycetes bacterium]|nr:hypothetical protein [Planctomycetota bacterium]